MDEAVFELERLREGLSDLRDGLADATLAATLIRPDRPAEVVKAGLTSAKASADKVWQAAVALAAVASIEAADSRREDGHGGDDVDRRVFGKLLGLLAGAALVPGAALDRLADLGEMLDRGGPLDEQVLTALREATATYAAAVESLPADTLARLVHVQVNRTVALLDESLQPSQRARLGSVAAETAALAGWLAFRADRRGEARSHLSLARDIARDNNDPALHAMALGSAAEVISPVGRSGKGSAVALRLLEQANVLVPGSASPTARAWLAGRLSVEQAALGDAEGARRAAGRAEMAFSESRDGFAHEPVTFTEHGVLGFWGADGIGLRSAVGKALALLGQPEGVELLWTTLEGDVAPYRAATARIDLAAAHLDLGQADEACTIAVGALVLAVESGGASRVERVRGLRSRLPHGAPGVRDLDELLAGV